MTAETDPTAAEKVSTDVDEWNSRSYPVSEDMGLQRRTWRAERLGWLCLLALVAAGLLGLFANGLLSSATATGADGRLEVFYGRFERSGAATTLQMRVRTDADEGVVLRISASFMAAFTIEALHPSPVEERAGTGVTEMIFRPVESPLQIYFTLRPERAGLVKSEIAIPGETPARLTQFIYP